MRRCASTIRSTALDAGKILVSRYADVERIYKDPKVFSSDKTVEFGAKYGATPALRAPHDEPRLQRPAAAHARPAPPRRRPQSARHRRHGGRRRAPRRRAPRRGAAGKPEIDLIDDFAAAIPVEVIGNLLDVPRAERGPLRGWSLAILGALEPFPSAERLTEGNRAVVDFLAYLEGLVDERRRRPRRSRQGPPDPAHPGRGERRAAAPRRSCCRTASSSSTPATRRRRTSSATACGS